MQIRLRGTPTEHTAALAVLARVLDITTVSRSYPDRPPSTYERIYISAALRSTQEAKQ